MITGNCRVVFNNILSEWSMIQNLVDDLLFVGKLYISDLMPKKLFPATNLPTLANAIVINTNKRLVSQVGYSDRVFKPASRPPLSTFISFFSPRINSTCDFTSYLIINLP